MPPKAERDKESCRGTAGVKGVSKYGGHIHSFVEKPVLFETHKCFGKGMKGEVIISDDDTKLFIVVKPKIDCKELQENFIILRDWMIKYQITFSLDKYVTL